MPEIVDPLVSPTARQAVSFQAHVELLQFFIGHRDAGVEKIHGLLNAQHKPPQFLQDHQLLSRLFLDGFFLLPGISSEQRLLRGQLEEAHWARGFKPRALPDMPNDLVDPADMMTRAFYMWEKTRWPGSSGRLRYAHTLFNLYLIRQLALLSMRAWDAGAGDAAARLSQAQRVLDSLWKSSPTDQPVLVRDLRWLVPVALSPATDDLTPYFEVAEHIDATVPDEDRLAILDAVVRTAGGHLRSFLHFYVVQHGIPLSENALIVHTRKTNALDFSLLIHALVPLLEAYECCLQSGNIKRRLVLADIVFQGVSPDPDLLVNRVDLLGAYTMVEHLFVTVDEGGHAIYTPLGQRHVRMLEDYASRIGRLAKPLYEDCRTFKPIDGAYSPYGLLYGYASNLLEYAAFKTLQRDDVTDFSLEDAFTDGDAAKLAWVSGWRKLPHVDQELQRLYAYPQSFADAVFARVEQALRARAVDEEALAAPGTGRLFVLSAEDAGLESAQIPALATRYIETSDAQIVAAGEAQACDEGPLVNARLEGHFVVSYQTQGGWVAITKDFLTEVLGAGVDARIAGLPQAAAERLRLMCRDLV